MLVKKVLKSRYLLIHFKMNRRGQYSKINQQDRNRLISAFERGEDYIVVATVLQIKHQTANSIIRKFQATGEREPRNKGGAKNVKMNADMKLYLVGLVENKPTITLQEMKNQMELNNPEWPVVTVQCIAKALDGELISLKQLRNCPQQRNSEVVKIARRDYMLWWSEEAEHDTLVYVDEMGFNLWTSRTQGRARLGERAVRQIARQRGQNVTVTLAVSPLHGLVYNSIKRGGQTTESFAGFLSELTELLEGERITIILDNAPAHAQPTGLNEGHLLKFLPQYSPFLNIAETRLIPLRLL